MDWHGWSPDLRMLALLTVLWASCVGGQSSDAVTRKLPIQVVVRVGTATGQAPVDDYLAQELARSQVDAVVGGVGAAAIGLGTYGIAAAPLAVVLLPIAAMEASDARRNAETINRVLREFDMGTRARNWIRARTVNSLDQPSRVRLDLLITRYGLVRYGYEVCAIASAEVRITLDERQTLFEALSIDGSGRTKDTPPAECARIERFGEFDGRRLRNALDEYAVVLSALALARAGQVVEEVSR